MDYSSRRRSFERPETKKIKNNFVLSFIKKHKKILIKSGVFIFALLMIAQLIYPANYMLPFQKVDGIDYGGKTKDYVVKDLDQRYQKLRADFYVNGSNSIYKSVDLVDLGFSNFTNQSRIDSYSYPWYLRLIPFSVLWSGLTVNVDEAPQYNKDSAILNDFITTTFGDDCHIDPVDASLVYSSSGLTVLEASNGGSCDSTEIYNSIYNVDLKIDNASINISSSGNQSPKIATATANLYAEKIKKIIGDSIKLKFGSESYSIPKSEIYSWLLFDNSNNKITLSFDNDKSKTYIKETLGKKVYKSEGTTRLHTLDYIETARESGKDGQKINVDKTNDSIFKLLNGEIENSEIYVDSVPAKIVYDKKEITNDSNLQSAVENFANSHTGNYAVYFQELAGSYKKATYRSTQTFTTASTYKLFVAYSVLLRIESGEWSWSDYIAGQTISDCFDQMISLSDNTCGEAFLDRIGRSAVTNEAHSVGSNDTYFNNDGIDSTATDLAILLIKLQTSQILKNQDSRDKLINAMKNNVYVLGIPNGTSGTVADKVGFLFNLLHDASIVYNSKDTYVLVILTENSSWSNIAALTKEIENAR